MSRASAANTLTDPAVTVIIPARNCLRYLPAAIDSVKAQGVPNVEIIVIDDGSTDGAAQWLEAQSAEATPYLTTLAGGGEGPSVARNRGIAAARAPLLAFLDADDVWLPGKLVNQVAFHAANPETAFSFTNYLHVDPEGRSYGTCFEYWPAFRRIAKSASMPVSYQHLTSPHARLITENVVGTSTVMARRDALQNASGFDASLRYAEDWDLWLRLAVAGQVGFTAKLGVHYLMRRPGSASEDVRLRIECMRRIVATHAPAVAAAGGAAALRRAWALVLMTEADLARSEQRHRAAVAADLAALCRAPSLHLARALLSDSLRATKLLPKSFR